MWTWAYLNKSDSIGTMPGKMSMTCSLMLLLVGDVLTHTLTPSPTTEKPLSPRHYQHIDPATGNKLVCDKCPAGTYVSSHCTEASIRECSPCPDGTFTRGENGVQQCHRCQRSCQAPFVEKTPCTSTTDQLCVCPPGSFSLGGKCQHHSLCPPGWGVRKRGSETEDVRCRPCQRGTFSNVASDALRCQAHSDCASLGLTLLIKGTEKTDSVCGPVSSVYVQLGEASISTVSSTESAYRASTAVLPTAETQDVAEPALSSTETALGTEDIPTTTASSKASEEDGGLLIAATQDLPKSQHKLPVSRDPQLDNQQAVETLSEGKAQGLGYRPIRRGSPRPSTHKHFDINEHLPWMIVLLLLLVLVVIVVCSVKRSSRVLKKGPRQDPSSIMEKAIHKKPSSPVQTKERWIYYSNGQGVDILKLVAAQIGSQWIDMYKSLASANEREVAAFSNGYSADHERAYAALQHWTIRDSDANLAKLINALHRQRRIDVVDKIRSVMEDNPQVDLNKLMTAVNVSHCLSPSHKPLESPGVVVEQSPMERTKGFFPDESEPLLRCDSTSSKDSALSRTGSFITKEKKDTVLRQVRLDPCDLQPIFDDMLHILNPEELHVIEEIPMAEDKLDRLFEIAGVKSQEASQTLLDSVYSHLPDLL
ncbi:tumor necrosis factor receptor superfamily member 21 [Pimephales promelas]|uniref:tumor necrosis factor receptor superfamily member 21 n=1 Tax=Pimephales promelas TaxID=90988 RepID=UPI00195559D8|nr:tumor necrosis factor receptor superfamily member 21 [Pimephales promelas]KAG1963593.1 tumor necrosis factor receptor superfamily [Pimephales promelas]